MVKIKELKLPVIILKEGRQFIAYSPSLDLSTSANSFEKAKKRLEEIIKIFFSEIIEMGTLEETLQDLGWKKQKKVWAPPFIISQELESIKVPLYQ